MIAEKTLLICCLRNIIFDKFKFYNVSSHDSVMTDIEIKVFKHLLCDCVTTIFYVFLSIFVLLHVYCLIILGSVPCILLQVIVTVKPSFLVGL